MINYFTNNLLVIFGLSISAFAIWLTWWVYRGKIKADKIERQRERLVELITESNAVNTWHERELSHFLFTGKRLNGYPPIGRVSALALHFVELSDQTSKLVTADADFMYHLNKLHLKCYPDKPYASSKDEWEKLLRCKDEVLHANTELYNHACDVMKQLRSGKDER